MMIIDAHHHLWDPQRRNYVWMTDDVAPIRRRFCVDDLLAMLPAQVIATIVVQAHASVEETREVCSEPLATAIASPASSDGSISMRRMSASV